MALASYVSVRPDPLDIRSAGNCPHPRSQIPISRCRARNRCRGLEQAALPQKVRSGALMLVFTNAGMLVTGTAPAKLAWLVLSTLAATVSGDSYQIVQSGTCASAGGESISSGLAACTAAGAELSIAWTWNLEHDSPHVPSGCIVTSTGSNLYFNPRDSSKACGTETSSTWFCVCRMVGAKWPPSPPPLPPDYGCWQASALSESCDTRCASLGGCSGEDTLRHKNEIDSHAEVKVLFESLTDETCGSPTQMYTWDTVPLFYQSGNMHCMGKTGASSAEDFNCGASSTVAKRLCWCSSCASPPPFAPGAVPPAPPPPAYVKLQTDGECQGWSLTPSVCYPNSGCSTAKACQDLCDQSDKCGATTFMQYSADSCATRARARAPAPAPPKLHSPAPHLPVSPLPVLTLAAPLRGRLVALPVRG